MNSKAFPQRLKEAIRRKGFTIDQLAAETKISASTIKKWTGGHSDPGMLNLVTAAETLGVSVEWLATGRAPSEPNEAPSKDQLQAPSMTMSSEADGVLLGRLAEAIERLYEKEHARVGTRALVELTTKHYNRIAAFTGNPDARLAMIAPVIDELRAELRRAPAADTSSKRRA